MESSDYDYIVYKFRKGDEKAFAQIYDLFYDPIYYFACRFLNDRAEAEDVTAEIFVKLWNLRANFETLQKIKAFLYISTRNACLDCLRARQRSTGMQRELLYLLLQNNDVTFIQDEVKVDVFKQIRDEIENLPPQCRKIFKSSYVNGLKNMEIANEMGLSLQTVKNQKVRAIKLLRLTIK